MNETEPPPPPLSERIFDWIGGIVFPRQQDWERRRSAKIMTAAVAFGLVLGWAVAKIIRHLYGAHH